MKAVLEAGTDVAALCLFDPALLDTTVDEQTKANFVKTLAELHAANRLVHIETGSDGAYSTGRTASLVAFNLTARLPGVGSALVRSVFNVCASLSQTLTSLDPWERISAESPRQGEA